MTAAPTRNDLYSEQAETAIIGAALINDSIIPQVAEILTPGDFHLERCRYAFEAELALCVRGQAIDLLTIENELRARGKWAEVGAQFLQECELIPNADHATGYATIVKDFARRRRALDISSALTRAAFSDNGDFAPELGRAVLSLKLMADSLTPEIDDSRFIVHWAQEALEPQPAIDWVIENLLSAGSVAIIAGEGGVKKTWTLLDLAVCVALGQKWLDFQTRAGLALIVDEESGKKRMNRRLADVLRGHNADGTTAVGHISLAGLNMIEPRDVEQLRLTVLSLGARLVIIDALVDILGGCDENSASEIAPVFHALRTIAEEAQCVIVVIDHTNRMGDYRGSSAKKGACDLLLLVTSDKNSSYVEFKTEKARDIESVTFAGNCNFFAGSFYMSPAMATAKAEHFSKSESYVLRYLCEHGVSSVKDVKDHADVCTPETARRTIYRLVERGKIRRVDSGSDGDTATYALVENDTRSAA